MAIMVRVQLTLLFGGAIFLAFASMIKADVDEYGCTDEAHAECEELDTEFQCVYSKLKRYLTLTHFRNSNF